MSTSSVVKSGPRHELKNLIIGSTFLVPAFATIPFFLMPVALGIAFGLLAAIVLPIALAGLGLGYYLPIEKGHKKIVYAKIGYATGFVTGLYIVYFLLFLPPNPSPEQLLVLGPSFVSALAGLAVPIIASKITIGMSDVNQPSSQPVKRFGRSENKLDSKIYFIVVIVYMVCICLSILISIASPTMYP